MELLLYTIKRPEKWRYFVLLAFDRVPVAQLVECPLRGTGGHGFDPGPRHTKVVKMVLAAPRLALRLTG